MSKDNLLSVKNLKIQFAAEQEVVKAVKNISFDIQKGETLGVVGESGSGKSVTALSIMGLLSQNATVEAEKMDFGVGEKKSLNDFSTTDWQNFRGQQAAMIFQEPMSSLNPVFKCGEQVVEAVLLHQKITKDEAKSYVLDLFQKVELKDTERIFEAYPHQLSGGQKQRVMIAMAISCNPQLLIADEPTTALDVTVQKAILKLMNGLKSEINASILFISHDLGVIAEIADRVIVMYKGEIVEEGTVEQIFNNPKHAYTKGLIACRPPLEKKLKRLPVIDDFKEKETAIDTYLKELEVSLNDEKNRLKMLQEKEAVLSVNGLKTWFPSEKSFWGKVKKYVKAVDEVNFDVYPGETLGLVGESGSGKTTLGRSILRLQEPTDGDIQFFNQDVRSLDYKDLRAFRKKAQIIFQDPYSSLNPRMTIGQAIKEPMEVHGIGENDKDRIERTKALLERVQLKAEHYSRFPFEFSGGQRQRIGIARALAVEPSFIVCDESVSALDVSIQAQILNLLLDLQEEKKLTYIFISHDLSVVRFMSDRIMVMKDGKIVEMGSANQIYSSPQSPYTQQLIEAIPKRF